MVTAENKHVAAWGLLVKAARAGLDGMDRDEHGHGVVAAAEGLLEVLSEEFDETRPVDPRLAVAQEALQQLWYASGQVLVAPTPLAQAKALVAMEEARGVARTALAMLRSAIGLSDSAS